MAKLFEKQRTNFYYNWLSFIEDLLKSFLVCFLMGHSVYIYRPTFSHYLQTIVISPLSRRLSWPPAAICAKPVSRPRKFRLSRKLAEKNIRLSRRENSGLNTKKSIRPTKVFSILKLSANRHGLLYHLSSALLCFFCVYV